MVAAHRPALAALGVLEGSSDAVVATDAQGRVVVWNRAAEKLLGYRADEVLGRPCYDVLDGIDPCGARFCRRECELTRMARRRETVRQFEMSVRTSSGGRVTAAFSILTVPGPSADEFTIFHVFRAAGDARPADRPRRAASAPDGVAAPHLGLTPREAEILRRLDDGASTSDIAGTLRISPTTVRTHIQHILRKLEVHSRLEAVALTLRRHLI
jgi:PAS domain S-box-containing protein